MWTPEILIAICATFLLAGLVKGVIGLGLPTVSLALLAATLGLKEAIALMVIPSFVTNLWQGLVGGAIAVIGRRLWTLLVAVCIGTWVGVGLLAQSDAVLLSGVLGGLLCIYSAVSLATVQIPPPGRSERWLSPTIGAVNGLLTGLTGSFVVPGVLYLQALGLPRDVLVQAMGILFTVSTAAVAVALGGHDLLSLELGTLSAVGLGPALLGIVLGRRARRQLPEARFRTVFFGGLLVLGAYIAGRAFL
jgi:uncharacterized membrane protein YfcA